MAEAKIKIDILNLEEVQEMLEKNKQERLEEQHRSAERIAMLESLVDEVHAENIALKAKLDTVDFIDRFKPIFEEHLLKPLLSELIKNVIEKERKPGGILHDR